MRIGDPARQCCRRRWTGSRSTYNQLNDECFIKTAVNQWVCETLYIDGGYHIID